MRILFISHEASRSGAPLALLHVIDTLKNQYEKLETDIFLLKDGPLRVDFEKRGNVCLYKPSLLERVKTRFGCKTNIDQYWKCLPSKSYGLIYANTVCSLYAAKQISDKLGTNVIAHIHESEYLTHWFRMTDQHFDFCKSIICVSELSKRNLVNHYGLKSDRIHIQHPYSNFVQNHQGIDNISVQSFGKLSGGPFVVGLSGSGEWIKSFDILPLIINKVHAEYPEVSVRYLLVGCPDEDAQYRVFFDLKKMGLDSLLSVTGMVENPMEYYSTFDVFLMISREDSFPLVAEENALLGKPIIAFSGATGVSEWLDSSAGIQVPYMDIDAVAKAIRDLYYDRDCLRSMGANAKELILRDFSKFSDMNAIKDQIDLLYHDN